MCIVTLTIFGKVSVVYHSMFVSQLVWVSLTRVNLSRFRFKVYVTDGSFYKSRPKPTAWTHVVLNFHGPNNGEGIAIFFNGAAVARDASKFTVRYSSGYGRIVVGRFYTNTDQRLLVHLVLIVVYSQDIWAKDATLLSMDAVVVLLYGNPL